MVKYVKYIHFFIRTVELGCNEIQEESYCCLTHHGVTIHLYQFCYFSVHHTIISLFYFMKSAFFSLSLEPCINTELQSSISL